MNHSLRSSPNTCCRFLRMPTLKPFLSGPLTKTGAVKASKKKEKESESGLNSPLSKYLFEQSSYIYEMMRAASWEGSKGVPFSNKYVNPHLKWIGSWRPTNSGSQRGTWDWRRTWAPQTWGRGHGTLQVHLASPPGREKQENEKLEKMDLKRFYSIHLVICSCGIAIVLTVCNTSM